MRAPAAYTRAHGCCIAVLCCGTCSAALFLLWCKRCAIIVCQVVVHHLCRQLQQLCMCNQLVRSIAVATTPPSAGRKQGEEAPEVFRAVMEQVAEALINAAAALLSPAAQVCRGRTLLCLQLARQQHAVQCQQNV